MQKVEIYKELEIFGKQYEVTISTNCFMSDDGIGDYEFQGYKGHQSIPVVEAEEKCSFKLDDWTDPEDVKRDVPVTPELNEWLNKYCTDNWEQLSKQLTEKFDKDE